jgi:hypothetical protein
VSYATDKRRHTSQRARLTRAINKKDPRKIIAVCEEAFKVFDTYEHGWPDDWSRWQRAKDDAETTIRFSSYTRGF